MRKTCGYTISIRVVWRFDAKGFQNECGVPNMVVHFTKMSHTQFLMGQNGLSTETGRFQLLLHGIWVPGSSFQGPTQVFALPQIFHVFAGFASLVMGLAWGSHGPHIAVQSTLLVGKHWKTRLQESIRKCKTSMRSAFSSIFTWFSAWTLASFCWKACSKIIWRPMIHVSSGASRAGSACKPSTSLSGVYHLYGIYDFPKSQVSPFERTMIKMCLLTISYARTARHNL